MQSAQECAERFARCEAAAEAAVADYNEMLVSVESMFSAEERESDDLPLLTGTTSDGRKCHIGLDRRIAGFRVEASGLTAEEIVECSETSTDGDLVRSMFPKTWRELSRATGAFRVETVKQAESGSAYRSLVRGFREGREASVRALLEARSAMRRTHRAERRARASALSFIQEMLSSRGLDPAGSSRDEALAMMSEVGVSSLATGSLRLAAEPVVVYDMAQFRTLRFEVHLVNARTSHDEAEARRFAENRARQDWVAVQRAHISDHLVKALYPEKYHSGLVLGNRLVLFDPESEERVHLKPR